MKIAIPAGIANKFGRQILTAQKHSPRLFFVAGIAGVLGSTILACRATLKLERTLDDFKFDVDEIHNQASSVDKGEYTRKLHAKNTLYVYTKGTMSIAKLYAPSILVGAASIGALTGSHVTLSRRNASLTAAYSAVQMSFDAYRDRVREELGEEKELDIHHGTRIEKVTVDGKTAQVRTADPNKWSPYAKFFDESNVNWVKDAELNRHFVQCQQNYLNQRLHARGHVFLNEAYDNLGIDRTSAGQIVGWVVGNGDNYIDFGIFEARNIGFVNGWERSILLDFNVDGIVYDLIDKK